MYIIQLIIIMLFASCTENELVLNDRNEVRIAETEIPSTAEINKDIPLHITAVAPNGCWSNIQISLTPKQDLHYLISATGNFNSNGMCTQSIVYKDTVINFRPPAKGKYIFQINKAPFDISYDTLIVQ